MCEYSGRGPECTTVVGVYAGEDGLDRERAGVVRRLVTVYWDLFANIDRERGTAGA
jgi:hypothetical protein